MIRLISLIFIASCFCPLVSAQTFVGRVIAINSSSDFDSTHEPKQVFIIETEARRRGARKRHFKIIFMVPTNGRRGGATPLDEKNLDYDRKWKFTLRSPSDEDEKYWCGRIDNFVRDDDGTIYVDGDGNPSLLFVSTQFDGKIVFESLSKMPCMVLTRIT